MIFPNIAFVCLVAGVSLAIATIAFDVILMIFRPPPGGFC